jgi:ubiquinone/menaquinone biosynthesis C-methylase UbiE
MSNHSAWQYDEMQQIGKDYGSVAEVEAYDSRHGKFRNVQKESQTILDRLAVRKKQFVLEFGTGTGTFAIEAAKRCAKVYAVDISLAMLEYARMKADSQGVGNIEFCYGGFLTYDHREDPVDVVVTSLALHHLPDFWKFAALSRMNSMLKYLGRLFLMDVVFAEENHMDNITKWIAGLEQIAGPEIAEDARRHVQREYSTFSWIMEGLLTRTGFRIDQADYLDGVIARYFCTKINSCT